MTTSLRSNPFFVASPLLSGTVKVPTLRARFVSFVQMLSRVAKIAYAYSANNSGSNFNNHDGFGTKEDWIPEFDGPGETKVFNNKVDELDGCDLKDTLICEFDGLEIFWIDNTVASKERTLYMDCVNPPEYEKMQKGWENDFSSLPRTKLENDSSRFDPFRSNTDKYEWLLLPGFDAIYRAQFMESFESELELSSHFEKQGFVSTETSNTEFNYLPGDLNDAFADVDPLTRSGHPAANSMRNTSQGRWLGDSDFSFVGENGSLLKFKSVAHLQAGIKSELGESDDPNDSGSTQDKRIIDKPRLKSDDGEEQLDEGFHDVVSVNNACPAVHQPISLKSKQTNTKSFGLQKRKRSKLKRSPRKRTRHHR